ncbi:MAG: hypothetical protein LBD87_03660 [Prevotellaceae bacterium]|jgi:uncharacterized protein (TIGR02145 family)|nr:hypothetical protein [Prevotellaceae bacterium]
MRAKIFFLVAMLASVATSAQITNVEPVGANYANKTVSFRVWWNAGTRDATHLSKVWVWVDYITVNSNNTTSGNTWTRAAISAASPTASVSYDGSNRKGFWLQGNNGSYSATVTVQLNVTETKFNWCAYVSDCPPNVTAANGTYTFKGTPPFTLIASNGTTTQTITGTTLAASALTITPTTIRDKTECPGVFCIYTGSDLYIDATHLCQQRTTGAKNWEAYIRDSRDSEIYRIVLMPDGKWWLAQNVKYAGTGQAISISGCTPEICGRYYTTDQFNIASGGTSGFGANKQGVCPNQWVLPITSDWNTLFTSVSSTTSVVCERLRSATCTCTPKTDYYGWANKMRVGYGNHAAYNCHWWDNANRYAIARIDHRHNVGNVCNVIETLTTVPDVALMAIRCFRQL